LVLRSVDINNSQSAFAQRKEILDITALGRNPACIRALVAAARELIDRQDMIDVHLFAEQSWEQDWRKHPRTLESVVLPDGQLEALVADVTWFAGAQSWYQGRGVPYRRGYLFSGQPGCGKTSLAFALTSHLRRPIYVLNLGSTASDVNLLKAFSGVPSNAVLLIEDIDAADASWNRTAERSGDGERITLSALLNGIDGMLAADGRLLIMTSNHPDRLDPAVVREGRVDRHERIGLAGRAEDETLFLRFHPNEHRLAKQFGLALHAPCPAAQLQEILVRHADEPEAAVDALRYLSPGESCAASISSSRTMRRDCTHPGGVLCSKKRTNK